ncbi:MAG: phosphotransferase, partial [Burkholderiaceae bacterium]
MSTAAAGADVIAPELSPWYAASREAWWQSAQQWVTAASSASELGPMQHTRIVRERPWSLIAKVDCARGSAYFKACASGGQQEPALLHWLAPQWPHWLPKIHAVDESRKFILLADAGRPVRDILGARGMQHALSQMLGAYATLQMQTLEQRAALLTIGLPDRGMDKLPALVEELLQSGAHAAGRSAQEADAIAAQVRAGHALLTEVCAELAATPYASALDHGDLHTGNLLTRRGSLALVDWGDACVTHPFCSALVALQFSVESMPLRSREAVLQIWRNAYLAPWQALAPRDVLQRHFAYALWAARIVRALDYAQMFTGADTQTLAPWRPLIGKALGQWAATRSVIERGEFDAVLPLLQEGLGPPPPL